MKSDLPIPLQQMMEEVYEDIRSLAHHPAFEDDAPEFNMGGRGYRACHRLKQWLELLRQNPEVVSSLAEVENKYRDIIAFFGTQVNWGQAVILREDWIDPAKEYQTKSGFRVIDLSIQLENSNGSEVTFPVKGSIVTKEKPLQVTYHIWTLDGRSSVMAASQKDLVLVKPSGDKLSN